MKLQYFLFRSLEFKQSLIEPLALVRQMNELMHEVVLLTGVVMPIFTSEFSSLLNLSFKATGTCQDGCTTGAISGSTLWSTP